MHNRIPVLHNNSTHAMSLWFAEMADKGLIFHPEDAASSIVLIRNGEPFFSAEEADKTQRILDGFFSRFGDESVNGAAYPHFMRAAGMPPGDE